MIRIMNVTQKITVPQTGLPIQLACFLHEKQLAKTLPPSSSRSGQSDIYISTTVYTIAFCSIIKNYFSYFD